MSVYAFGAFERLRRVAGPLKVRSWNTKPRDNRCRTVPSAVVAMAVTGPGDLPVILELRFAAQTMAFGRHFLILTWSDRVVAFRRIGACADTRVQSFVDIE